MTTVVNNPGNGESTSTGFILGIVVMTVVLIGLFLVYGLPMITSRTESPSAQNTQDKNIDVNVGVGSSN